MPAELTESEIIQGCIRKDRLVQEYLYRKYHSDYKKVCSRYASCEPDTRLLLNDSFYKIFTRIDQYNNDGAFEGWMRRIVVNTCLDYVKQKKRKESREMNKEQDELVSLNGHTANRAMGEIGYKELMKVIQELPETHKAVFNLNVFDGYSHNEIAKMLDISVGTSHWYLSKAREILKKKISL
jgi:RNA polymerase sigma factor (sigma-70 family)